MILTGNCEIEFKEWYRSLNLKIPYVVNEDGENDYWDLEYIHVFKNLPDAMKYGVYVDYFDSVGTYIQVLFYDFDCNNWQFFVECNNQDLDYGETHLTSRQEARTAAIEKANEIRNEQLNK